MHLLIGHFLCGVGKIKPVNTLLNYIGTLPGAKEPSVKALQASLVANVKACQGQVAIPGLISSLRERERHTRINGVVKLKFEVLERMINTKLPLFPVQKRKLVAAFKSFYNSPYNIDKFVKTLTDEQIPFAVIVFILRDYSTIVFGSSGTSFPSHPIPVVASDASPGSSVSPRVMTSALRHHLPKVKKVKKLVKSEPVHEPEVVVADPELIPAPAVELTLVSVPVTNTAMSLAAESVLTDSTGEREEKSADIVVDSKSLPGLKLAPDSKSVPAFVTKPPVLFGVESVPTMLASESKERFTLPADPAFLAEDEDLALFKKTVARLHRTKCTEKDLKIAYDRLVLFRHHLLPMEASEDQPAGQKHE